jgi:hypothetical protein
MVRSSDYNIKKVLSLDPGANAVTTVQGHYTEKGEMVKTKWHTNSPPTNKRTRRKALAEDYGPVVTHTETERRGTKDEAHDQNVAQTG